MTFSSLPYLFVDPPDGMEGRESRDAAHSPAASPAPQVGAPADLAELALVQRMARGDERALRELYDVTYERLWDFAHVVGGTRDRADELVQEAYTLLWERAGEWDPHSHVRGFLYLVVRNRARNHGRRERMAIQGETRRAAEIVAASMAAHPVPPDMRVEQQELVRAILHAVAELPEPRRTALVLRWREQLPYEEIARILGVSTALARQFVTRARATLRVRVGHLFE